MPVQPDIALQTASPNPTNFISSFIDLGQKKLNLDKSRETFAADVSQRIAESSRANTEASVAAQTAAPRVAQQVAQTGTAQAQLNDAQLQLARNHFANVAQVMSPLANDPDITPQKVTSAIVSTLQAVNAPPAAYAQTFQGMPAPTGDPKADAAALRGYVTQSLMKAQSAAKQLDTQYPTPTPVSTSSGTQFVSSGNPALTGQPAGVPGAAPALPPPNQIVADTTGATVVANPAQGTARPFTPSPAGGMPAPQMSLPPGETTQTQQGLQAERDAAKAVALNAPQMHDINRSIVQEVDKGVTTGTLGGLIQRIKSATGFAGPTEEGATDYNVLGKMLERSALTAAQGMGPHTNAGLEAQVRANGSTDYTPAAIRKIANLNDALTTGATLYQQGVENAIQQQGGGVFAKRQFDQQWAQVMNPSGGVNGVQALRLKNAVDNGDQKERDAVLAEVGGPRSPKAAALLQKLQLISKLSGQ